MIKIIDVDETMFNNSHFSLSDYFKMVNIEDLQDKLYYMLDEFFNDYDDAYTQYWSVQFYHKLTNYSVENEDIESACNHLKSYLEIINFYLRELQFFNQHHHNFSYY